MEIEIPQSLRIIEHNHENNLRGNFSMSKSKKAMEGKVWRQEQLLQTTNNKEERENQTSHTYCKSHYDDKRPKIYKARNVKKQKNPCGLEWNASILE